MVRHRHRDQLKVVDLLIGTRVSPDAEVQGLDLVEHGERGYVYEH